MKENCEFIKALKIIWMITVIFPIVILLLVFLFDDKTLSIVPECEYKAKGIKCILCGSTRAFLEIKNLNFHKAYELNNLSIFIFGFLILNSILFIKNIFNYYLKTKL
ncbi:MAG: DUF2752 domain-containing protein [Moheibacter sp.]